MKLEWSDLARADRDAIFDYLEAENPRAVIAVDECIQTQTEGLLRFPESGRPGRVEGTCELVILRTPYIAAYAIRGDTIRILRVLHGAQLWPEDVAGE